MKHAALAFLCVLASCAPTVEFGEGSFKVRGDIGLATSGILGDTGGGVEGMLQDRSTTATQVSTLEDSSLVFTDPATGATLEMNNLTVNRTSPAAVTWRGATGVIRQVKQILWGKWGIDAWKSNKAGGHETDQLGITDGGQTDRAAIAGQTTEALSGDAVRKVEIQELR